MNTNEIYQKITENIILQLNSFNKGEVNAKVMNENLILNLSSMCKFLKGKETLNNSNLDVYVPMSRLEYAVNSKIRGSTNDESKLNADGEEEAGKILNRAGTLDFENESFFGPENSKLNMDESLRDITMFSHKKNNSAVLGNNVNGDMFSNFGELLDQSEISTIYNGGKKGDTMDNLSLFNEQSFYNFHKKFKSTSSNDLNSSKFVISPRGNGNKLEKIMSSPIENETSLEDSSSIINISSISKESNSLSSLVKQVIEEVNNELKEKAVREFIKEMNADYIRSMYSIYSQIRQACNRNKECENLIFINKFKSFVLEIGISDKKFYEQCIREIIYNKNNLKFLEFLLCFHKLIYLKFDQNFLKYKFLFHITKRKNEEYMDSADLERFFELLKAKKIYDVELYNKITTKLVEKYRDIFPNDNKLFIRKLALVLEQFFDLK